MRTIGLDVGERNIGVAVSDESGTVAQPLTTLKREGRKGASAAIAGLARRYGAREAVVGLPLRMDGRVGDQAERVREFGERLGAESGLIVHFQDERLSSAEAARVLAVTDTPRSRKRESEHSIAAAIILQTWLSRQGSTAPGEDGP